MAFRYIPYLILVSLIVAGIYYLDHFKKQICLVCERPMHRATIYRLHLPQGEIVEVCCPRCGLHFQQRNKDVYKAEVADFNSGDLIDAHEAYYVEGSSVRVCCTEGTVQKDRAGVSYERTWDRCLPSVIAFRAATEAEEFIREHGGVRRAYTELTLEAKGVQ